MSFGAGVATFTAALWLFRETTWPWLPHTEADRWVVGAAFATVAATAVLAATAWWAGSDAPENPTAPEAAGSPRGSASQISGDNIDFSNCTFHGPVQGKGEQTNTLHHERR